MSEWKRYPQHSPPVGVAVMTKIHDANGARNEQVMRWRNNLWWVGSACSHCGSGETYVYYTPTHWRETSDE